MVTNVSSTWYISIHDDIDDPVGRLKVFVYKLSSKYNKKILQKDPRCLTHMFAAEIFMHRFLLSSPVRMLNPKEGNDPEDGYHAIGARAAAWENFKDNPLFVISTEHPTTYCEEMQRAVFCLCPLGWAPWSPRLVEVVIFGCIPVIIVDDIVLPFADAISWEEILSNLPLSPANKAGLIKVAISQKT
ncbi:hypothetical protein D5086_027441 [Populus alba]|uniref:Uncharacterized protein n=1 Tax=Populus alba TaxID=43335 RepID=A0ACC4AVE6_POPAL